MGVAPCITSRLCVAFAEIHDPVIFSGGLPPDTIYTGNRVSCDSKYRIRWFRFPRMDLGVCTVSLAFVFYHVNKRSLVLLPCAETVVADARVVPPGREDSKQSPAGGPFPAFSAREYTCPWWWSPVPSGSTLRIHRASSCFHVRRLL